MSGEAPPAEPPTKEMAEVRLDADGKPLSKNALKKLLKAEKAAKAKAEKAAKRVRLLRRSNICHAGCIIIHGKERRLLYFVIEGQTFIIILLILSLHSYRQFTSSCACQ